MIRRTNMSHYDTASLASDLLPRVGTRWCDYEKKALEIRKMAGSGLNERFEPATLAKILNYHILRFTAIDGLPESVRMTIVANDQWSGAAIPSDQLLASQVISDQSSDFPAGLIIINDTQSPLRQRATLMEEICHLLLGHQPSLIDSKGRTYDRAIEDEAYAIGAATLVPFKPLREMLQARRSPNEIARHFDVSRQLINYRIKVLRIEEDLSGTPSIRG